MQVNIKRLMAEIERYSTYGKDEDGGVTRPSFSEADLQARKLFAAQLEELGLDVEVDGIANIWGTLPGDGSSERPIVIGSHLDSVPNGGKYDGALGVLAAKEIVQTLRDHQTVLRHPLRIVSFTAEESNEFNFSTMGSRVYTGKLTSEQLAAAADSTGRTLESAVLEAGGNIRQLENRSKIAPAAFFELHIEQGKKLEKQNLPVGVVDKIVGIYRDTVTVKGQQNHSGTTVMGERQDALVAAGEMVSVIQQKAKALGSDAVATVGKFDVTPNAGNIIPGQVDFIMEIRSADKNEREGLAREIHRAFKEIADKHGASVTTQNFYNTQEQEFDEELRGWLAEAADKQSIPYTTLPSMAGHDAMHLVEVTKTAMLFVKSIGGISHNPAERSLPEDIEAGANVLLRALLEADKNL